LPNNRKSLERASIEIEELKAKLLWLEQLLHNRRFKSIYTQVLLLLVGRYLEEGQKEEERTENCIERWFVVSQ
jgi:hypothetical protein